ncbi:lectin 1a [Wolfiporia cocos MD-104 SS10]|uniref:Lectin 1a n=1 Tax=Wolfiporia cocos (strain MD-104) TaxID=742152 RepID=A0A2H3J1B2_WOLCO|nr:lectin 1a [Wolfiporia cocos MD-104 SS10]
MSYTIVVRVIDASDVGFSLVEKTVWYYANGGTWSNTNGIQTLVMGGSGTSGTLRFKSGDGEAFLVAVGVHNYKHWCDVAVDLTDGDTSMKVQPTYYESTDRAKVREEQLSEITRKNSKGRSISVKYVTQDSNTFHAIVTVS